MELIFLLLNCHWRCWASMVSFSDTTKILKHTIQVWLAIWFAKRKDFAPACKKCLFVFISFLFFFNFSIFGLIWNFKLCFNDFKKNNLKKIYLKEFSFKANHSPPNFSIQIAPMQNNFLVVSAPEINNENEQETIHP